MNSNFKMICISSNQNLGNLSVYSEPLQSDSKTTMHVKNIAQFIFTGEGLLVLSAVVITFFYTRPPNLSKEIGNVYSGIDRIKRLLDRESKTFAKKAEDLRERYGESETALTKLEQEFRDQSGQLREELRSQPLRGHGEIIVRQKQRKDGQEVEVEPENLALNLKGFQFFKERTV